NETLRQHTLRLKRRDLGHGGYAVPSVRRDRQSRLPMSDGGGFDELDVDLGKRTGIDPDFDNSWPHSRPWDSIFELFDPLFCQLPGRFPVSESRHILSMGRTIETGIGDDLQATRL